jgi:hypothetical protein
MTLIYAIATIRHNQEREYVETGEIDPVTLESKIRGVSKTLKAGEIHDVFPELAAEVLANGAARELTPTELALYQLRGPQT